MNYAETLDFIHSSSGVFCKPGLDRISALCHSLGNPESKLKFIHVGGTNGKGSTSSMLASILVAAGYRVGLYTSPYVKKFNERMRINGEEISDSELAEIADTVRPFVEKMTDKPTEFELITAIAFEYFRRGGCDVVVLEVGMGGRLDSTNVIENPLLSIITGISLDHVAFLGDTVEKIAFEKAGIIKHGCPVIFGGDSDEAKSVISRVASEKCAKIHYPDYQSIEIKSASLSGTKFNYKAHQNLSISLLGSYQPRNAAVVLEAVQILRDAGLAITDKAVAAGLKSARWPARFEVIHDEPTVIFDGAHNAEGIKAAVESIKQYFGNMRVIIFTGVLKDKDYEEIASCISSVAREAFTITPDNPRALSAEEYASVLSRYGTHATPCKSTKEAIRLGILTALENNTALCCLGSLYTYADVIKSVQDCKAIERNDK